MMMSLLLFGTACQQVEQGFWTKRGLSQAQFNTDYHRDFRECTQHGLQQGTLNDGGPETDTIQARHVSTSQTGRSAFNDCMYARGYEWMKMQPLVGSNPHGSTPDHVACSKDQLIVDPYGYPHCLSPKQIRPARSIDVPRDVPREASLPAKGLEPTIAPAAARPEPPRSREAVLTESSSREQPEPAQENRTVNTVRDPAQRRAFDESLCIQHSQASLSNPYETFLRCMEEKGWPMENSR
jgi:hypothetical protein